MDVSQGFEFARRFHPDLRIRAVVGGVVARWTDGAKVFEHTAPSEAELAHDLVTSICERHGFLAPTPMHDRSHLERAICEAAARGDTVLARQLGRDLVMANATRARGNVAPRAPITATIDRPPSPVDWIELPDLIDP